MRSLNLKMLFTVCFPWLSTYEALTFFSGREQELISLSLKPDSGVCTAKAQQGFGDSSQAEFHPCYRIVQQHLERLSQVINSFEIFRRTLIATVLILKQECSLGNEYCQI